MRACDTQGTLVCQPNGQKKPPNIPRQNKRQMTVNNFPFPGLMPVPVNSLHSLLQITQIISMDF